MLMVGLAILFFAMIMLSIALHEIGHLVPAKIFGVRVSQYMVGFGRTLWSRQRGETEYGIKMIPLGGYVRLIGMYPPERQATNKGWLERFADQARSYEYEEVRPDDQGRLFYEKPWWQKVIVMFGGIGMNLLLAFLIFLGIQVFHGYYQPSLQVSAVSQCVIPADRTEAGCLESDPPTPALQAGIKPGDEIVAANGTQVTSWQQMSELIRANGDGAMAIQVRRDGQLVELAEVNTVLTGVPDRLDPTTTVEAGFLGVSPSYELVHGGPVETVAQMWDMTRMSLVALANFPVRVYYVLADLVTGAPRDPNSPISIVGASIVAGELGAAEDISVGDRVATWMSLLGSVNLFVALLNLVPLLPLDGGHVAGALWEALRRAVARLLRRKDPGPVDTAKMLPVAYIVGGFLLLGGIVLIVADLISPVSLL